MLKKIFDRIKSYRYKKAISAKTIEERFSNIYNSDVWFGNKESRSGAGSTLLATEDIRKKLPQIIKELNGVLLLDIGCGDYNWMNQVELPCSYIGVDIVEDIIEENTKKFANERVSFQKINAIEDPIPKGCDIILCREVLFHLSYEDGLKLIENVVKSGAKYLIATSDKEVNENMNIWSGEFRNINLRLPPYNFSELKNEINDTGVSKSRILGVWSLNKLRSNN